jgi:hypothetical protein
MWHARSEGDVTCIACGTEVPRSNAREYDRFGDRWGKRDRDFEHLCKSCYRECCHQPRQGLEADLVRADAGDADRAAFLANYYDVVTDDAPRERE